MSAATDQINILHVDDEPDLTELTAEFLQRADDRFAVETATGPESGLNKLSSEVDCVISDYDMPEQNGIGFLETVREEYPDLPFILYTGKGSEEVASEAISTGATDYLQKGTSPEQYELLANRITNAVNSYRATRAKRTRQERRQQQREALANLVRSEAIITGEFETAIRQITETVASVLDVARVNIWMFDDDRRVLDCVDHYDRTAGRHTSNDQLDCDALPTYLDALQSQRVIDATIAAEDPRTEDLSEAYLEPHGILSMLDAPLRSDGELAGVICIEATETTREWTEDEIEFAGDIADLLHRTLRNRERDEHLRELAMHQSLLEAQQDAIDAGLLVVDEDGDLRSYNDRFIELFDVSQSVSEVDAERVLRQITAEVAAPGSACQQLTNLISDSTQTETGELSLANGQVYEWYSTPVIGDHTHYGRLYRFRDVTDAKAHLQTLESQTRAMDEAPISISISDPSQPDNPLIYVNDQFTTVTGYSREDVLGRNCRFLQGEETDESAVDEMRTAIENEQPVTVELRNYRKDGEMFWNRVSIAPVYDEDGALTNYISFQEDVTDRWERERELEEENERLSEYASMISHDIRNPLQAARGQIDYGRMTGDESAFEKAVDALDRIEEIIEDIMTLTRNEQELDRRVSTDIETIAREAWQTVDTGAMTLRVVADARINASPSALQELFENLFRNSLEHSDEAPTVTVGTIEPILTATRSDDDSLRGFYVADDGPGISEQERHLIFDSEFSTKSDGSGLGLPIVKRIADAHDWTVDITESHSGGARFEFVRPS